MRTHHLLTAMLSSFFVLSLPAQAVGFQTKGEVCPNPVTSCLATAYEFKANELSYHLPAELKWQTAHYSAPFYAVILRSIKAVQMQDTETGNEECKGFIEESERLTIQAKFPNHKVFTSRNGCAPMVFYSGVNDNYNFIAVHAGKTKAEAANLVEQAKRAGFKDASLRKMQVIMDNGH
jgi:hypothetical protein